MPLDSALIHVASAVRLVCSPWPNGVLFISAALKPCSVSMQVMRRVSRSCTRWVSAKYLGSSHKSTLDHTGALAQVALFKRRVLGAAFLRPQRFAFGFKQLGRVAVCQHLAELGNAIGS
jgi:hypothetical protein